VTLDAVRTSFYRRIGSHLTRITRFFGELYILPDASGNDLFDALECKTKQVLESLEDLPDLRPRPDDGGAVIVLNGFFNSCLDIQGALIGLRQKLRRYDRLAVVLYNPYLKGIYHLASSLGWRRGEPITTFVTENDLINLARISDYELVRLDYALCFPFKLFGLGLLIDSFMRAIPGLRAFGLVCIGVFRPIVAEPAPRKISVVIPARNERGNIAAAIERMPEFDGIEREVIFVEGGSSDGTWDEIERVKVAYGNLMQIRSYKQQGKGKCDAVRLGFANATGDLLTILDADLTMPPELLGRFVEAYRRGSADFVNGNRLVYPMEGQAMRFLNRLGNIFFAKAVGAVLGTRLGDTLCGTKLVSRRDYKRFEAWREWFGDFDPFGDFELIFPAACLALGIADVPIRYRDRTYGSTNIHRFRHGFLLLRMTWVGFTRIRLGWG
jgi:hypothetical protein